MMDETLPSVTTTTAHERPLMKLLQIKRLKLGWRGKARAGKLGSPVPASKLLAFPPLVEESPTVVSLSEDDSFTDLSSEFVDPLSVHEEQVQITVDKPKTEKKSVSFSNVQVREYRRILGDNPSTEGGFPLALDWAFNQQSQVYDIDRHQQMGEERGRCHSVDLGSLDVHERRLRLRAVGYTEQELRLAERRRKVQQAHEWAFGMNHGCPPVSITNKFIERYVR